MALNLETTVSAENFLPPRKSLSTLASAAQQCRGCELYRNATQAVFGVGKRDAPLMLVGEQPGDHEDQLGQPFVGPAGQLLDKALAAAGIARDAVYVTNAVKHFKWEPRGKRRLHTKPSEREIAACHPWLREELRLVAPRLVVCLGVSAARAVLNRAITISRVRGTILEAAENQPTLVTTHPSALLRLRESAERDAAFKALVADLDTAAKFSAQ